MAWPSNTYIATDKLTHTIVNSISSALRTWGGDVNAGGYKLSNLIELNVAPVIDQSAGASSVVIEPTFTGTGNTTISYAFQVAQADPTKIDSSDFFNGIGVDLHCNTPKWYVAGVTPNQNAAILAFMSCYKGADAFGADIHAIVPAGSTEAPNNVIGAQITIDLHQDGLTYGNRIGAFVTCSSNTSPKTPGTSGIQFGGDAGFSTLIDNQQAAFINEGIILWPAATVTADKRAYALLNATATQTPWFVDIAGRQVTQSLRVAGTGVAASVSGTGAVHFTGNTARIVDSARTPATSGEACFTGEIAFDASYIYVAVGTNSWKRVALSSF